jgi:hypothetical protein
LNLRALAPLFFASKLLRKYEGAKCVQGKKYYSWGFGEHSKFEECWGGVFRRFVLVTYKPNSGIHQTVFVA